MGGTISRIESLLAIAALRQPTRASGVDGRDTPADLALQKAIDERRRSSEIAAQFAPLPLELVLANRSREYARLTTEAGIVDRWTAGLLTPCNCPPPSGFARVNNASTFGLAGNASQPRALEPRVVQQLLSGSLTTTRNSPKPVTGRLIDVVA
jgi:hypothetical protein